MSCRILKISESQSSLIGSGDHLFKQLCPWSGRVCVKCLVYPIERKTSKAARFQIDETVSLFFSEKFRFWDTGIFFAVA